MQRRSFFLLQSLVAIFIWVLVVVLFWRWIFDVATTVFSSGDGEASLATLVGALTVISLAFSLLQFSMTRFQRYIQASTDDSDR